MRVGVLTGGGDCPGLNAVIRGIVRKGVQEYGYDFVGYRDGWRGPLEGDTVRLDIPAVRGILPRGGTILGSSRTNPLKQENGIRRIKENLAKQEVDALIAIGGEDTLGVAARLTDEYGVPVRRRAQDHRQRPVRHRLHLRLRHRGRHRDGGHRPPAHHRRVPYAGPGLRGDGPSRRLDRLHSGLAGGANVILIPEQRFDVDQVCAWVTSRFKASYAPIVVVAEGAMPKDGDVVLKDGSLDSFGHVRLSGVGEWLAKEIEKRTGKEARTTVLGHIQRGGTPSAFDRWLATRFGLHAIDAVRDGDFGKMVALRGTDIVRVPIAEATAKLKTVDPKLYEEVGVFFG